MAGCGDTCRCAIQGSTNVGVNGVGTPSNPYIVDGCPNLRDCMGTTGVLAESTEWSDRLMQAHLKVTPNAMTFGSDGGLYVPQAAGGILNCAQMTADCLPNGWAGGISWDTSVSPAKAVVQPSATSDTERQNTIVYKGNGVWAPQYEVWYTIPLSALASSCYTQIPSTPLPQVRMERDGMIRWRGNINPTACGVSSSFTYMEFVGEWSWLRPKGGVDAGYFFPIYASPDTNRVYFHIEDDQAGWGIGGNGGSASAAGFIVLDGVNYY